jgi:outer membrane protein OmpA-like peptidoglycan-associated protein
MKKILMVALCIPLILAGCAAPQTKTQKGALIGTGVGAAAGAGLGQAIGGDTKATLLGAGIGAVVGGLAGGTMGRYMDNQEAAMRQQLAGVEAANVQRNADVLAITFKADMLFDFDSSTLKAGAYDEIARVAQVLVQYPQTNITIAGHTDNKGTETYNQQLSERRAQVVKNALAGQGVNPGRLSVVGYGESRPVASNNTESGRQHNRRVEITIVPQQ